MSEKRKIIDSKVTYGKDDIIVETGKPEKKKIKNTGKKKKVKKIILIIVAVLVALLIAFYLLFAVNLLQGNYGKTRNKTK